MKNKAILIHARNVTGLGASQVVSSLMKALIGQAGDRDMLFALPVQGSLSRLDIGERNKKNIKNVLPNSLFRMIECLFPRLFYPMMEQNIILGDIPLRGFKNQLVLVHQPNLINPRVNPNSSRSMIFKIMRKVFEGNLKGVKYIIVQSDVMKDELIQSYPVLSGRVEVVPQPAPDWFLKPELTPKVHSEGLRLFYPAANYPHKNHLLIADLDRLGGLDCVKKWIVTLQDGQCVGNLSENSKVHHVGQLSPQGCMVFYNSVDALFFPSLAESYGLPLVEAMLSGLPILCSDLPYARWMCEEEAIYFDPLSRESAAEAIQELERRLALGWEPDWSKALSKLPANWDEVAQDFMRLLK